MARTAEKVRDLTEQSDGMTHALETVLERSEDHGKVEWGDVNDELSSGQWGRLIEKGILVDDQEEGFVVANPEGVQEALGGTTDGSEDDEPDDVTWTKWDKIAGLLSISMMAGYSISSIRSTIGGIMDMFLGPLNQWLPFYIVVLIIALFTGLWTSLLQETLMDSDVMAKYQDRMKDIQERRKAAKERGDDDELQRIQEEQMEAMGDQLGMFKAQFRPMVWTMLLTIPVFLWMYWMIRDGHLIGGGAMVLPIVGEVNDLQQQIIVVPAWMLWYFLCSMGFSQIIRKAMNVQVSPST